MNVCADLRPLLLGIGNSLRGDDGLGRAVAEQLARDGELDGEILSVHQLTPELASSIARASFVIMIDASCEGRPGEVGVRILSSPGQFVGAVGAHHLTPEELLTLTSLVYSRCPPVIVISVTGRDFGIGEHLSLPVTQALLPVSVLVRKMYILIEREKNDDAFDDVWHGACHALLDNADLLARPVSGRVHPLADLSSTDESKGRA